MTKCLCGMAYKGSPFSWKVVTSQTYLMSTSDISLKNFRFLKRCGLHFSPEVPYCLSVFSSDKFPLSCTLKRIIICAVLLPHALVAYCSNWNMAQKWREWRKYLCIRASDYNIYYLHNVSSQLLLLRTNLPMLVFLLNVILKTFGCHWTVKRYVSCSECFTVTRNFKEADASASHAVLHNTRWSFSHCYFIFLGDFNWLSCHLTWSSKVAQGDNNN